MPSKIPSQHPTDTRVRTEHPSVTPTQIPSILPTINPTNIPSTIPTSNPTTSPTSNPTTSPTSNPSKTQTNQSTITPSVDPTKSPSDIPSTLPTNIQSNTVSTSPSINPMILSTNVPTSQRKGLYIICHYNDNKDYIIQFITLFNYAKTMMNVILSSVQSTSLQPINYESSVNNEVTAWKRAGIFDFTICTVFDTMLSNQNCPSYTNIVKESQYIAFGTFGIVVDNELSVYKQWIIKQFESAELTNEVTLNMNDKLDNITSVTRTRMLLSDVYNSFEMFKIEIIDPNDTTISIISTIDNGESKDNNLHSSNKSNTDIHIFIIVTVVICLILIIVTACVLYFKKSNIYNDNAEGEGEYNDVDIEMHGREGIDEDVITKHADIDKIIDAMKINDVNVDQVVNIINNTHDVERNADEDIIDIINQRQETHSMHANNVDEGDIIEALNQTYKGVHEMNIDEKENIGKELRDLHEIEQHLHTGI
eukprot:187240_1